MHAAHYVQHRDSKDDKFEEIIPCPICGANLHRDWSSDPICEVEDNDDDTSSNDREYNTNYTYFSNTYHNHNRPMFDDDTTSIIVSKKDGDESKVDKILKRIFLFLLTIATVAILAFFLVLELKHYIPMKYSQDQIIGLSYSDAYNRLYESGFTNIRGKEIPDLDISEETSAGVITAVFADNHYYENTRQKKESKSKNRSLSS